MVGGPALLGTPSTIILRGRSLRSRVEPVLSLVLGAAQPAVVLRGSPEILLRGSPRYDLSKKVLLLI